MIIKKRTIASPRVTENAQEAQEKLGKVESAENSYLRARRARRKALKKVEGGVGKAHFRDENGKSGQDSPRYRRHQTTRNEGDDTLPSFQIR